MPRTISSRQTIFVKFVFPVAWLGVSVSFAFVLWFKRAEAPGFKKPFLLESLVVGVFVFWFARRLKKVRVDEEFLYVSNWRSEVRVPLRDVSDCLWRNWWRPAWVVVRLRAQTRFGKHIVFIPKSQWRHLGIHPVVGELRFLVDQARERLPRLARRLRATETYRLGLRPEARCPA